MTTTVNTNKSQLPPKNSAHRKDQMVRAAFDWRLMNRELRVWIYLVQCDYGSTTRKHAAFPKMETIAQELNMGLSTVKRAISTLEELGYLTITKDKKYGKAYAHNVYHLATVLPEIPVNYRSRLNLNSVGHTQNQGSGVNLNSVNHRSPAQNHRSPAKYHRSRVNKPQVTREPLITGIKPENIEEQEVYKTSKDINPEIKHQNISAPIGAGCSAPPLNETDTDTETTDMSLEDNLETKELYRQILELPNTDNTLSDEAAQETMKLSLHQNINPPNTHNIDSEEIMEIIDDPDTGLDVEEPKPTKQIIERPLVDYLEVMGVTNPVIRKNCYSWQDTFFIPMQQHKSYDEVMHEYKRFIDGQILRWPTPKSNLQSAAESLKSKLGDIS